VIVGGGPAGLSASIWLARYLHRVVLVDSGDPRNWETRGINGFLGHPGIRPAELRGKGRDEARAQGVTLIDAVCDTVHCPGASGFDLFLADKTKVFFASNYDGSDESYMDDFINKVAYGLNLVFSNGIGYPRTNFLLSGGAKALRHRAADVTGGPGKEDSHVRFLA